MYTIKRTDSDDLDFQSLVQLLDADLAIRDGEDHSFYAQFNKIDSIRHVVVIFEKDVAIGCGAIKKYGDNTAEVKRMFVLPEKRGKGAAGMILKELEQWAKELHYTKCILETGKKQPEAIALYAKHAYRQIPNYGQYVDVTDSVCFEKEL
ncbi:GNAT family N-acetyltransferase [Flavobacterium sp. NRK F10]|uniref:GNAT family N-acetyltransferase n=1 Tax=Flavobacterium sp. NRK F10 TaxID=2954931 RepID=UPI002091BBD0|nr:GNAT family N-acetyltransferase [Flavobacterium sp. NRK F10]MCO6175653.1 GNAT family N-acetyltransferase [Flavobacterium sp. NRK F10]